MAIFFLALTLQSELRRPRTDGYGRLFGKQVSGHPVIPKPEIVREAPVEDQTAADPLLIAPAAREQYLGVNAREQELPNRVEAAERPAVRDDGKVVVGPNGVTIVRGATRRPLLSGGIFRR